MPRAKLYPLSDVCRQAQIRRDLAEKIANEHNIPFSRVGSASYISKTAANKLFPKLQKAAAEIRSIKATTVRRVKYKEIYFIKCNEFIKIGYTYHLATRMERLQVGSPYKLELIHSMPGTPDDEAVLHSRFASLHVRGEWFRHEGALASFIDGLKLCANAKSRSESRKAEEFEELRAAMNVATTSKTGAYNNSAHST